MLVSALLLKSHLGSRKGEKGVFCNASWLLRIERESVFSYFAYGGARQKHQKLSGDCVLPLFVFPEDDGIEMQRQESALRLRTTTGRIEEVTQK